MDSLHGVSRDQLFKTGGPTRGPGVNFNRSLRYRNVAWGFALFWTVLLSGFAIWELQEISKHSEERARADANMSFQKDVLFRHWASKHGGVYVPVTADTPPNPYLENIPERDIVTPSGRQLTLINPAYMTRQMHDLAKDRFGVASHITSLNPIRPGNSADPWETKALRQFEAGVPEVCETLVNEGEPILRFMRPFITEQSCLKCHGVQGYKVGDVRGGISVTISLKEYHTAARHQMLEELAFYIAIWLIGLGGVSVGFHQLTLRRKAHLRSIEELRNSEEKFSTVFHHSPVFTCITTLEDGTYVEVNEQAFRTLEYHRSELIGKKSIDLGVYSPQERQRFLEALRRQGKVKDLEIVFKTKTGRQITTLTSAEIISIGGQRYLLSAVIDITERRRVENALAHNDAELSAIYEHAPSMKMIVDKDGFVRRLNRAAAVLSKAIADSNQAGGSSVPITLLGCIQSPSTTCNCSFGLNRQNCPLRNAILDTRKTGHSHEKIEIQSQLRLGHPDIPLTLLASTALIQVNDERMVLVCMEDISQQKAAEQRIREQAALLDVTHDAFVVVDLQGQVAYWNLGATKITGWPAAEALGKSLSSLLALKSQPALPEILQHIRTNGSWHGESVLCNRHNTTIATRCHGVLMRDATSKEHTILLSFSDITDAKKIETQLFRAQRLESIGSLAGGVAHDLNNVLGPIMLSLSSLRKLARDPQSREIVELIDRSVHRGSDIVSKLLLFGRGADSNAPREAVSFAALVGELHHILQETFPKNITVSIQIPDDLWPVHGDKTQLYQVLLNLCVNARDAMPQGGTLTLRAENTSITEPFAKRQPGAHPGPHVLIDVTDTGTGIPDEIIDKIFDPFFTTKPVGQGSGLGLSTSLGIVNSHNGFITVQSRPDVGTTFRLHLPVSTNPNSQDPIAPDTSALGGQGEHILVVDDEASILHTAKLLLTASGYRVTTANGGQDALDLLSRPDHNIELVVTDIMMPSMDGLQLVQALREKNPMMPVVAMSGLRGNRIPFDLLPPPKIFHLFKPFEAETLLATLHTALHDKQA